MAKRYSVIHAFYHETGDKDVEGHPIKKYYTRDNQDELSELPASVLKDKVARGLVAEDDSAAPAAAEPSDRIGSAAGPAASQAAAEPEASDGKRRAKGK